MVRWLPGRKLRLQLWYHDVMMVLVIASYEPLACILIFIELV
jgi:hypothetical protein